MLQISGEIVRIETDQPFAVRSRVQGDDGFDEVVDIATVVIVAHDSNHRIARGNF